MLQQAKDHENHSFDQNRKKENIGERPRVSRLLCPFVFETEADRGLDLSFKEADISHKENLPLDSWPVDSLGLASDGDRIFPKEA